MTWLDRTLANQTNQPSLRVTLTNKSTHLNSFPKRLSTNNPCSPRPHWYRARTSLKSTRASPCKSSNRKVTAVLCLAITRSQSKCPTTSDKHSATASNSRLNKTRPSTSLSNTNHSHVVSSPIRINSASCPTDRHKNKQTRIEEECKTSLGSLTNSFTSHHRVFKTT